MIGDQQSLSEQLDRFHKGMVQRMCGRDVEALSGLEEELRRAGVGQDVLQPGDTAPEFSLPDQHGKQVRLTDCLEHGPVVLVFFRGGWCPFCALTLRAWQDALDGLHDAGGDLLAVSPQPCSGCSQTAERDLLAFSVLSDHGCKVADSYRIAFDMPEAARPLYAKLGHDLPRINGTGTWRLPLPASFVIGTDRRIALTHSQIANWKRLDPGDAVAAVRRVNAQGAQAEPFKPGCRSPGSRSK